MCSGTETSSSMPRLAMAPARVSSPLKKGTGSELMPRRTTERRFVRGACPLLQRPLRFTALRTMGLDNRIGKPRKGHRDTKSCGDTVRRYNRGVGRPAGHLAI